MSYFRIDYSRKQADRFVIGAVAAAAAGSAPALSTGGPRLRVRTN